MAVSNRNGHGVTNMATPHNMHVQPANLQFPDTQGPAAHNGGSGGTKGFPPKGAKRGPSSAPTQGQTGVAWAPGTSK